MALTIQEIKAFILGQPQSEETVRQIEIEAAIDDPTSDVRQISSGFAKRARLLAAVDGSLLGNPRVFPDDLMESEQL